MVPLFACAFLLSLVLMSSFHALPTQDAALFGVFKDIYVGCPVVHFVLLICNHNNGKTVSRSAPITKQNIDYDRHPNLTLFAHSTFYFLSLVLSSHICFYQSVCVLLVSSLSSNYISLSTLSCSFVPSHSPLCFSLFVSVASQL